MERPIILWMVSRSRSSLVSKIFHKHGIHMSPDITKSCGYDTYENNDIKRLQVVLLGKPRGYRLPQCEIIHPSEEEKIEFKKQLNRIISGNVRWGMKTGIEYIECYQQLNPFNIYIKRDTKAVVDSVMKKSNSSDYKTAMNNTEWRYKKMDYYYKKYGGIWVNTDKIIKNNYDDIEKAMDYCNIDFNLNICKKANYENN